MDEYGKLLKEIKEQIKVAQLKTVVAANSQMLWLYWHIGNFILENQNVTGWGSKIIENLSKDIKKEFPELKGFSTRNLAYMRNFAASYPKYLLEKLTVIKKQFSTNLEQIKESLLFLERLEI